MHNHWMKGGPKHVKSTSLMWCSLREWNIKAGCRDMRLLSLLQKRSDKKQPVHKGLGRLSQPPFRFRKSFKPFGNIHNVGKCHVQSFTVISPQSLVLFAWLPVLTQTQTSNQTTIQPPQHPTTQTPTSQVPSALPATQQNQSMWLWEAWSGQPGKNPTWF